MQRVNSVYGVISHAQSSKHLSRTLIQNSMSRVTSAVSYQLSHGETGLPLHHSSQVALVKFSGRLDNR